jgi:hypothetical protein
MLPKFALAVSLLAISSVIEARALRCYSVSDKLDRLADQVGKPGGKAGMFERLDRFRQGFAVSRCHVRSLLQRQYFLRRGLLFLLS